MKQFWSSLKSFVTVSMVLLLASVIIANLFGYRLDENLLLLFTNLITSIFTYYFAKKEDETSEPDEEHAVDE